MGFLTKVRNLLHPPQPVFQKTNLIPSSTPADDLINEVRMNRMLLISLHQRLDMLDASVYGDETFH
jgi:hypothetical protein